MMIIDLRTKKDISKTIMLNKIFGFIEEGNLKTDKEIVVEGFTLKVGNVYFFSGKGKDGIHYKMREGVTKVTRALKKKHEKASSRIIKSKNKEKIKKLRNKMKSISQALKDIADDRWDSE